MPSFIGVQIRDPAIDNIMVLVHYVAVHGNRMFKATARKMCVSEGVWGRDYIYRGRRDPCSLIRLIGRFSCARAHGTSKPMAFIAK